MDKLPYTESEIQRELDMFYNIIDFDNITRKTLFYMIDFLKTGKYKGERPQTKENMESVNHMYNFIKSSPNTENDNQQIRANNIINTIERFLQRNIVFVQDGGNTYLRDMYKISQFIIGTQTLITLVGEVHEHRIECKNDIPAIGIDDFAVRQVNNDFSEIYLEIPEHVGVHNYNEVGSIPIRDIFSKLQQVNKIDKIKKIDIRENILGGADRLLYQTDVNTFGNKLTKVNLSPKNYSELQEIFNSVENPVKIISLYNEDILESQSNDDNNKFREKLVESECLETEIIIKIRVLENIAVVNEFINTVCKKWKMNIIFNRYRRTLTQEMFSSLFLDNENLENNIDSLVLNNCQGITNVSILGNIREVILDNCQGITDVSMLGNVEVLSLNNCQGITDVSMLGRVRKLNLDNCQGITDVSMLGNVEVLSLNNCRNLKEHNISETEVKNEEQLSPPFFTIDTNKIIEWYINPFIHFYNYEMSQNTNFESYLKFLRSKFENLHVNLGKYNISQIRDILQQLWAEVTDYNILKELLKHNPMVVNKVIIVGRAHYDNIFNILNEMRDVSLINKQEVSSDVSGLNCIQLYSVVEWSNLN